MFDNRMSEEIVWTQLDLDEITKACPERSRRDVKTHGLIIPICHQIEAWSIDKLLDKHVTKVSAEATIESEIIALPVDS